MNYDLHEESEANNSNTIFARWINADYEWVESLDQQLKTINHSQVKVAYCTNKYYSKRYWKRISGKAYPLAGLNEAGLLLTESS
jgi:hypothetical protein